MTISRRQFLGCSAALPFLFQELAEAQRKRVKIRDVQVMMLQGASRTYTLVKIVADDGLHGIAEGYGSPGVGVKEQILSLKPWLVGKDPLEIDALYTFMGRGRSDLSGTRTDGSAHNLMRAVSGIEMALWDLAGKILDVPATTLLGGRFRDRVRVYDHAAPRNMLDKASCREWADKVKARSERLHRHKFGFPNTDPADDHGARSLQSHADDDGAARIRSRDSRTAAKPIGWDHDIMVHCHWEYDLRTSIQIARGGGADQAGLARGPAAGRLFRFLEAAVRELEGADLHGREPRAPRRLQGLHHQPGRATSCIRTCGTPAGSSRPNASPIWRTSTACRWRPTIPAARSIPTRRPVGGVDPRLHGAARPSPAKAAGWIRCWCLTARTSRTGSFR